MRHYILIRIKTNKKSKVLLKLNKINVDIRNVVYEKDALVLEIFADDIKRVKKYLLSEKLEKLDETGIYKFKKTLKNNMLTIVALIFAICVFLVLSNVVVSVNVVHENSEIRKLLYDALEERGVYPLTFKKSYEEYERIISDIRNTYKDKIEWLEIDVEGMIINVRIEERIINSEEKEEGYCHIVASRSGVVKSVLTQKGVAEVRLNDFVKKDDILISGEIKLNEEVKNNVCAKGEVMAEVWYNVGVSLPLDYIEEEFTGKMRFNFMVKNGIDEYVILKSRVSKSKSKNILLFKLFGFEFYIQKEYEIKEIVKTYSEEEALNKAKELIYEKLLVKGSDTNNIINEKYLKKNVNNGNLDIDMFIAIKEQIGVRKSYSVEVEESDTNVE